MTEGLIGAAVGVLIVTFACVIRGQRWMYAIGLLTLPSLYACFALQAGEKSVALQEMLYGAPFLVAGVVFAAVSVRHSAVLVGALWILHGLYDLTHSQLVANPGVPGWYPVWCFSVDLVVGAYLLWLSRHIANANLRQA